MRALLCGVLVSVLWHVFILYVNPFPKIERLFWGGGVGPIISTLGFVGIAFTVETIINHRRFIREVSRVVMMVDNTGDSLGLLDQYKQSGLDKIKGDLEFVKVFPGTCIALGLLGTLVGLGRGMDNLSVIWIEAIDIVTIKSEILQFIRSLSKSFDSAILGTAFSIVITFFISTWQRWVEKKIGNILDEKRKSILMEWDKLPKT